MRTALVLFMLSVSLAGLSSCANTLEGVGQDIENAGEAIQNGF